MFLRERIYEIIELSQDGDETSMLYDGFMMTIIVLSLVPLTMKSPGQFASLDGLAADIFIIDYILRLITADYKLKKGPLSFFAYPFTPMAIIDLVAILPSVSGLQNSFRLFKLFRLLRTFQVFRIFKLLRYSKSITRIAMVFYKQREPLIAVCASAVAYVIIVALVIFNVEPESFATFYDAVYWAVISLTTVGYGDLYPVTDIGRAVTIVSSFFGTAVIALPSGIITAGYMKELDQEKKEEKRSKKKHKHH